MIGWENIQKPRKKEFNYQQLQLTSLNMCPCDTTIAGPDPDSQSGTGCNKQSRDPRLEYCATSQAKVGDEPNVSSILFGAGLLTVYLAVQHFYTSWKFCRGAHYVTDFMADSQKLSFSSLINIPLYPS